MAQSSDLPRLAAPTLLSLTAYSDATATVEFLGVLATDPATGKHSRVAYTAKATPITPVTGDPVDGTVTPAAAEVDGTKDDDFSAVYEAKFTGLTELTQYEVVVTGTGDGTTTRDSLPNVAHITTIKKESP